MSVLSAPAQLAVLGGTPHAPSLTRPTWPPVKEDVAKRLGEVYMSGRWSFNESCEQQFAADFAAYHGAEYGIFMANGTVTLECALGVHGIGPGDEVIVPALTWPATAMAVLYLGATPVFADIDPGTLCLSSQAFEAAITPRTKAVIPVHLYGGNADLEEILAIAARHDILVIEDCAHAHAGKWNGKGVGSWGKVGSFSFQQSKTMASGEGGICITSDPETAQRLYLMKHIGYSSGVLPGAASSGPPVGLTCHNFRGTEFQAVILQDQLQDIQALIERYNANAARIEERLSGVPGVRVQSRGRLADPQSYYAFGLIFDEEPTASVPLDRLREALHAEGLTMFGRTYGCVYNHPLWNIEAEKFRKSEGGCPVAEQIGSQRTLVMLHEWLGSETGAIDAIGEGVVKVVAQASSL